METGQRRITPKQQRFVMEHLINLTPPKWRFKWVRRYIVKAAGTISSASKRLTPRPDQQSGRGVFSRVTAVSSNLSVLSSLSSQIFEGRGLTLLLGTVSVSQYRAGRAGVQEVGLHRATMGL